MHECDEANDVQNQQDQGVQKYQHHSAQAGEVKMPFFSKGQEFLVAVV